MEEGMGQVTVEVMERGACQFDMSGRSLGYPLHTVEGEISPGLVKRLLKYAKERLECVGFSPFGTINVYTMDGPS
jgi:hypothetical protein